MKPVYADDWMQVFGGDCRAVMAELPAGSVDAVITSPPYWQLREYPVPETVWDDVKGVCRDHVWGPYIPTRQKSGTSVGGFLNADKAGGGRDTARAKMAGRLCTRCGTAWLGQLGLEPTSTDYVRHIVEVFSHVWRVLKDDGVAWLVLGDCYAAANYPGEGLKKGDLVGIPWAVAFALRRAGWFLKTDIVWAKGASYGPYHGNPMPESPTRRPNRAHEFIFLLAKTAQHYYDVDAVLEPSATGSWSAMPPIGGVKKGGGATYSGNTPASDGMRRQRDVWTIQTVKYPDAHYAVFPPALVSPMVRASTKVFETILDPFAGSGTTGMVAQSLSRKAILIDAAADEYTVQQMRRAAQIPLGMEV